MFFRLVTQLISRCWQQYGNLFLVFSCMSYCYSLKIGLIHWGGGQHEKQTLQQWLVYYLTGLENILVGHETVFPHLGCVWLSPVNSSWWQLKVKAVKQHNWSSLIHFECITRSWHFRQKSNLKAGCLFYGLTDSFHAEHVFLTILLCDSILPFLQPIFPPCFLSSGVVGDSVWSRVTRAQGRSMATGQSGHPGPAAREAVKVESPFETGSATTLGREMWCGNRKLDISATMQYILENTKLMSVSSLCEWHHWGGDVLTSCSVASCSCN